MTEVSLRLDQVADLGFYIQQKKCMNLSDPGTGKTPSVVVNQYRRLQDGMKTAWVQPKALIDKNVQEIIRFTGLREKDIAVVDGTPAQIQRALLSDAGIYLLGPDRLKKTYGALHEQGVKALDVDEIHMCFGGATSARTVAFFELMRFMDECVLMSGTLVNGRLDTAYPAIQAIEPRYYPFGYDQFMGAHAYLDEYNRPIAWHGHSRIGEICGRHGIRRTFESIFGKQEVVFETQWVSMHPEQRRLFDKFRDEAFLELEKFMIDGTLPGVAMTRARQLMEHPNLFPDLTDPKAPRVNLIGAERPAKEQALEIHFEDHKRLGTPVIVFAFYVPQQRRIVELAQSMGLRAAMMNGECTRAEKKAVDEQFRAGLLDVIVISPAVGSVGFNWQFWGPLQIEVDHVIFASLGFMDSDFAQGFRRAIRQARLKALRVTTLAYYDSTDLRMMGILIRKSKDANLVDPTRDVISFDSHGDLPLAA